MKYVLFLIWFSFSWMWEQRDLVSTQYFTVSHIWKSTILESKFKFKLWVYLDSFFLSCKFIFKGSIQNLFIKIRSNSYEENWSFSIFPHFCKKYLLFTPYIIEMKTLMMVKIMVVQTIRRQKIEKFLQIQESFSYFFVFMCNKDVINFIKCDFMLVRCI